ncbi:MAG: sulfotransferase [Pseudomonadota bacterium]
MRLYKEGLAVSWELFGFSRNFVFFVGVILFFMTHSAFTAATLFLDRFFFPKFRKVQVRQPVFIIGHPRSGTTFIHHLFTRTGEMASFATWQLLFPAITARIIVRPIVRLLTGQSPAVLIPETTGHQIALDAVEEEEMLFLHNHDTQFTIIGTPLGFAEKDYREIRFHDRQPKKQRIRSALFLQSIFQRHIYDTGKTRIFAQTHFSTHRIKTLMEVFPDAKFIYMHRMPEETLPSYLSLSFYTLDALWGMHRFSGRQKANYYNRRYEASLELYRYFYDLWHNHELDRERILIVPYKRLRRELMPVFEEIVAFTGIKPSAKLRNAVALQAGKQRSYERKHAMNTLADFGISTDRVRKDFAFLYADDPFGLRSKGRQDA